VNPNLRLRAIADRLFNSVKTTPYSSRRVIVQAVEESEVRAWFKGALTIGTTWTKIGKKTRTALDNIYRGRKHYIPDEICTVYKAGTSIIGGTRDTLEGLTDFSQSHEFGRLCAKRFKGGNIGLIYELKVFWRSVFKSKLQRVKTAAVITFSHLTLNKHSGGYVVRLPDFHGLLKSQEAKLRDIALTYSKLFDDNEDGTETDDDNVIPEAAADPESQLEARLAERIMQGTGDWAKETYN
jgi:hypothetical protein